MKIAFFSLCFVLSHLTISAEEIHVERRSFLDSLQFHAALDLGINGQLYNASNNDQILSIFAEKMLDEQSGYREIIGKARSDVNETERELHKKKLELSCRLWPEVVAQLPKNLRKQWDDKKVRLHLEEVIGGMEVDGKTIDPDAQKNSQQKVIIFVLNGEAKKEEDKIFQDPGLEGQRQALNFFRFLYCSWKLPFQDYRVWAPESTWGLCTGILGLEGVLAMKKANLARLIEERTSFNRKQSRKIAGKAKRGLRFIDKKLLGKKRRVKFFKGAAIAQGILYIYDYKVSLEDKVKKQEEELRKKDEDYTKDLIRVSEKHDEIRSLDGRRIFDTKD